MLIENNPQLYKSPQNTKKQNINFGIKIESSEKFIEFVAKNFTKKTRRK